MFSRWKCDPLLHLHMIISFGIWKPTRRKQIERNLDIWSLILWSFWIYKLYIQFVLFNYLIPWSWYSLIPLKFKAIEIQVEFPFLFSVDGKEILNTCSNIFQVLLGDTGAGKTSLVLRFVKGQFCDYHVRFYDWSFYFYLIFTITSSSLNFHLARP